MSTTGITHTRKPNAPVIKCDRCRALILPLEPYRAVRKNVPGSSSARETMRFCAACLAKGVR